MSAYRRTTENSKMKIEAKEIISRLIAWKGQTYTDELDINVGQGEGKEIFKWFLASILFGARISENIARNTFKAFEKNMLNTPEDISQAGWNLLVETLDAGGYVRYDFKTADKLLVVMQNLLETYQGDLNLLHAHSKDSRDLERRIRALGKGIGGITVQIFLRELRGVWKKARPFLNSFTLLCARNTGLLSIKELDNETALFMVEQLWLNFGRTKTDFPLFEAALLRVGKDFCRKDRCKVCQMLPLCKK